MKFQKGQSGNPGGRPKQSESLTLLAREYTDDALNTLIKIMEDKDAPKSSRVSAAQTILDRGWGKAPQTIDLNTNPLDNMDADEQRLLLEALQLIREDADGDGVPVTETTH